MSELVFEKLSDESLAEIAGGMTPELRAAYACIRGDYGNGADRTTNLLRAGYDPALVQSLVNGIMNGYDKVAVDVINGKYGVDAARVNALRKAGYDPNAVQLLVNHMLWN